MTELVLPRRRFLQTFVGLVAAPAIVKADNLIRVVTWKAPDAHRTIRVYMDIQTIRDRNVLLNTWYDIRVNNEEWSIEYCRIA